MENNLNDNAMEVTAEMQQCLEAIAKNTKFIYLTGVAGTGKSTFLNYIIKNCDKKMIVLAPTGVAAINIGGQTIHSFCRLKSEAQDINRIRKHNDTAEVIKKIDFVIVDEISMVRSDLFDALNETFKKSKENNEFFGGAQVLVMGDLFQLPPVVAKKSNDFEILQHLGYDPYQPFFFNSKSFHERENSLFGNTDIFKAELTKVFRQKNTDFVNFLYKVRNGSVSDVELSDFNKICLANKGVKDEKEAVILTTINSVADQENSTNLAALKGKQNNYIAIITGDFNENDCASPRELKLKVGAKVIFTRTAGAFKNGEIGIVKKMSKNSIVVEIGDRDVDVEPIAWENCKYSVIEGKVKKKVLGSMAQLPVKLGWAITIHKSQGQTFDKVIIDLANGAFAAGQLYVALSRCTSMEGIYLKKAIRKKDVIVNKQVGRFLANSN